jgi:hypothetical protein
MSLINDALKKAQKSQTQQPATAAAPVAPISARMAGKPGVVMSFERMLLLVAVLAAVIVGAIAIAVVLLRKDDRPVVAKAANPAHTLPVAASSPAPAPVRTSAIAARPVVLPPPSPAAPQAPEPVSAPLITVATVHQSAPISLPPPAAAAISVDPSASPAPVVANVGPTPPVAQPAPPVPTPPQDAAAEKRSRILSFIENAHIAGVRLAGGESKVLMNEHVYRVNSVVSMELGLRLTGVGAETLTFVDENGVVYTKTF